MRFVLFLFFIAAIPALARADDSGCWPSDVESLVAADSGQKPWIGKTFPGSRIAPAGGRYDIVVERPAKPVSYYGAFLEIDGTPYRVGSRSISAGVVGEGDPRRTKGLAAQNDVELTINLPDVDGFGWQHASLVIAGCDDKLARVAEWDVSTLVSDRLSLLLATCVVTGLIYLFAAFCCKAKEDRIKDHNTRMSFKRYLDPVVLTSGPNGKGSLARLQVLFFSVIVFSILLYSVLRLGVIADISTDILTLMGISAVGAATANATDLTRNRLDWENWTWLVQRKWLPVNGLAAITRARWADLITTDDGFDVYHFQMLIFSLVVGAALLEISYTDLATFTISSSILGILGLSQVVYVGGKLVAPPSCKDLNDAVGQLRTQEEELCPRWAALAAPPASVESAEKDVPGSKQYLQLLAKTEILFRTTMGDMTLYAYKGPAWANVRPSPAVVQKPEAISGDPTSEAGAGADA